MKAKEFFYNVATDRANGALASLTKILLLVLSWVYFLLAKLNHLLYKTSLKKSFKLEKPVISVGNITWGGTGKTPLVAFLAKELKSKGKKPVILTRGYMQKKDEDSDEAVMLKEELGIPVLVGSKRAMNAIEFLRENEADIFILDDGFQHFAAKRDLDILVVDSTNPWGNGHLIPRGILRESKKESRRSDIVLLTKTDAEISEHEALKDYFSNEDRNKLVVETAHVPTKVIDLASREEKSLDSIKGKEVLCLCSIGDPYGFIRSLTNCGCRVKEKLSFMDHHVYSAQDIRNISRVCAEQNIKTIVTTQKDAVKLREFISEFNKDIEVLSLKAEVSITTNKELFLERINYLL